jgi:large repetitive protein
MKKRINLFLSLMILLSGFVIRAQAPVISSFTPTTGGQSAQVIITGSNFIGVTAVSFGGTAAFFFSVNSPTQITAFVGAGSTGQVSVTNPSGTGSLPGFTYTGPIITSFTPTSGAQGTTVTINGSNFTGSTIVWFGGIVASSFTVLSDNSISAVVGSGTSGNVSVTNAFGSGSLSGFTYTGPIITSFSPTFAAPGSTITISGQNFTGATVVDFGGLSATSFTVLNDNTITAVNGIGYSGSINVTGPNGSGSRVGFVMLPTISSFTPLSGSTGTSVTINGLNFNAIPSSNSVYFGAVKGAVTSASPTSLSVTAPAGATYRPISVNANSYMAYTSQPFILTFPNGGGPFYTSSFASKKIFTGGGSDYPFIVDLDGDNKGDIITTFSTGTFAAFKNTSAGGVISFSGPTNFTTGGTPVMAFSEDLNGDKKPDVVVSNYASNTISAFRNTSTVSVISFLAKVDFPTGTNPRGVAIQDIDGNGFPDIVVTNYNSNAISLFRNTSSSGSLITMATKVDFATGTNPHSVSIADIDGDGKVDIIVTNSGSSTVSVFRNTSTSGIISFDAKVDFTTGNNPRPVSTGDMDGDGKLDLIIGNGGSSTVSLLRNTSISGSISFEPKVDFATRIGPNFLSVHDMNGDGKPDIAIANQSPSSYSIFRNLSSTGVFSLATRKDYEDPDFAGVGIATGDMNTDGKPEIILGKGFAIEAYRNKINEAPVFTSFSPSTVIIGDSLFINGKNLTGLTSIKIGGIALGTFNILTDTTVTAIIETETGGEIKLINEYDSASLPGLSVIPLPHITSFTPTSGPLGTTVTINGNNFTPAPSGNIVFFGAVKASVLTASSSVLTVSVPRGATYEPISVTTNSNRTAYSNKPFLVTFPGATSSFSPTSFAAKIDSAYGTATEQIALSDIDGDGRIDAGIVGNSGLVNYRNIGDSGVIAFAPKISNNNNQNPRQLVISDLNGDGKPDITIANNSDIRPGSVYKNNSTSGIISLGPEMPITYGSLSQFSVCSGDLDGDALPDLAIGSDYSNVSLFRNTSTVGNIQFGARVPITAVGIKFCLNDFDGDGKLDIATAFPSSFNILVYRNLSTPGHFIFSSSIPFLTGTTGSWNVVSGDLDGDGKPDLVATRNNLVVCVYLNTSTPGVISFAPRIEYPTLSYYGYATIGDLDGDAKPEIVIAGSSAQKVQVYKNTCTPGVISFQVPKNYSVGVEPLFVAIGDLDGDGKPDISVTNRVSNSVSFLRNKIGEPPVIRLCPPIAATLLTSSIEGTNYQWQLDTGSGFANIINNANYSGTTTLNLQLTAIPSSWYGYQYRCVVDGNNSDTVTIKFGNFWIGAVSTEWENSANWSCGTVPDSNTDVVINSGSVVVLNSNTTIRTLTIRPGANFTINSGYILIITN